MSYKSREKKRRRKAAQANVRDRHGETMKSRHYLTIVTRACCCNGCGNPLRRGREAVYRYQPREIVCLTCAEQRGLKFRISLRWEKARRKAPGSGSAGSQGQR